jgi:N-acetylglucosamine malate deacetylase 1
MKILVIAPHPDDEVLGCGGTIKKYSQEKGNEIYRCIVSKTYAPDWSKEFLKNRKREIKNSGEILNIKKTFFLDFPAAKLDTIPQKKLIEAISGLIETTKPQILFIPHGGGLSQDHKAVFYAALIASRPYHPARIKKILSYEVPSESEWSVSWEPFIPNVYIGIKNEINDKLKAMACYQSEIRPFPHPRSLEMLKTIAQQRGGECNLNFAEAFVLIREIQK